MNMIPLAHATATQIQALKQDNRILKAQTAERILDSDEQIAVLHDRVRILTTTVQAATDPLTNTSDTSDNQHYVGNTYKTYSTQVEALHNKYDLKADWGCMTLKNIVDVRAAFMIGRGVQVVARSGYKGNPERELAFIREFINFNNIDEEAPQDWAVGTELEGKVLLHILPVSKDQYPAYPLGMIRVAYVPWLTLQYVVTDDTPNYYRYLKADYHGYAVRPDNKQVNVSFHVTEPEFVYRRFGGGAAKVNATPPKSAFVLRHIEDLDKELWDWRKINSLFAAPTPVFEVETVEEAERLNAEIEKKNWRIGMAIVIAGGKFKLEMYKGEGYTTIQKAAEADVQAISGATGVPVHFLGHPELLSNRATAENLLELIELSTGKERKIWIGAYEELFQKAIVMYNAAFNQNLKPMAITAEIPFTSSQSLAVIQNVYLPMYQAGAMSLTQLLSYLSEVDADQEIKNIKEDKANDLSASGSTPGNGGVGNSRDGRPGVAGENQGGRR